MLVGTLLREIPPSLVDGVALGQFRVAGSVIQSTTTGRIVGHLQETSGLATALNDGSNLLGLSSIKAAEVALQAVNVVQSEQIKAAVGVVKSLQIANLALSGLSIGVSVAGTALLAQRINRVESKVDAILPSLTTIANGLERLQTEAISADFIRLRTLASQVDEAWLPSATPSEWISIARESHFLADSFEHRARNLSDITDAACREPFVEAFNVASALRITARLAAGQDDMARQAATNCAESLLALGEPVKLGRLVLASVQNGDLTATADWPEHLNRKRDLALALVTSMRERELAAAACVETLNELDTQEITGREWLEASRTENKNPLLFLPVGEALE